MPSLTTWKKLQALSGLAFGSFLVMHLACHYSLLIGFDAASENLLKFRKIYQHPAFEGMLVVSLLTHMASNAVLIGSRGKANAAAKKEGGKPPAGSMELSAHRFAGYVLAAGLFPHVAFGRLIPLLLLRDPSKVGYSFIAESIVSIPYYMFPIFLVVFGVAAVWHFIYGVRSGLANLMGSSVLGTPFPMVLKPMAMGFHLLTLGAVLALGGFFYVVDRKPGKALEDELLHRGQELFASWTSK